MFKSPLALIEPSTVNSVVSGVVAGIPIPTKPPSVLPDTLITALLEFEPDAIVNPRL